MALAAFAWAETVTLRLKWLHGAQFAGYYAASGEGFYAEEDLEVLFVDGPTDFEEFDAVVSGQFDFMVADALRVLQAPSQGIPIAAIAAIYQTDPLVLFSLAEQGIHSPYQLVGKTVMSFGVMLPALMKRLAIPMETIDVVGLSHDLSLLYSGDVDVWMGYITNEAVRAREDGHAINIIHPSDYGVNIYGDALITSRQLIDEEPDLVLRFLRATLRGWNYVTRNPERSARYALRLNPGLDPEHEILALHASLPLLSSGRAPIGWMDPMRWQFAADTLREHGQGVVELDASLAFDMQFLERIYGEEE